MKYHHIKGIDKPVSRLIQGAAYFTDQNPDEAFEIFDTVFEGGINTFDTAHVYGKGASDRVLGMWINERDIQDDVVVIGKGAHPYDGQQRVTPEDITNDIQDSLERLKLDKIDLYVLHRDDETQAVEPIMDCLFQHYSDGHITAIGASNWSHQRIQQANNYANTNNLLPFVASSPQFSLAEMVKPSWDGCISIGHNKAAQAWYKQNEMALLTWSSLAGGFMTGKFQQDNLDSFDDYFDGVTINAYAYADNFQRLDRANQLAEKHEITLPQLALAYVLNQPLNIFALIGNRAKSDFLDNVHALNIELSDNELAWLNLEVDTLVK